MEHYSLSTFFVLIIELPLAEETEYFDLNDCASMKYV